MRLARVIAAFALFLATASAARAEYVVLRSGQRLHVTGYQLLDGNKYRLQLVGGFVEVPVEEVTAIEPEDRFAPLPPAPPEKAPLHDIIESAAKKYNLDAELIASVIAAESNFDPNAISPRNARGLMQLLPETAARFGVQNIFDPQENVDAGTRYLSELLRRYNNDLVLALAAYNAGPDKVQQFGRVPPYRETTSYIRRVKRTYDKKKSSQPAKSSESNSSANKASSSLTQTARTKPANSAQLTAIP